MTIREVSGKIDIRLNKGASGDYDNVWKSLKKEAFNKAVLEWFRQQKRGINATKEGDEETDTLVDDLQVLLQSEVMTVRNKGSYAQTGKLPIDYLYFKRLTPHVSNGKCPSIQIKSYLKEEANVDNLVSFPSYDFEETFHTLIGNKINIYHFGNFKVDKVLLTYYRKPKVYDFKNLDEIIEFKEDVCDILVDKAVAIISSDIESFNQKAASQERAEFQ